MVTCSGCLCYPKNEGEVAEEKNRVSEEDSPINTEPEKENGYGATGQSPPIITSQI